ncbi:hypothetical protein [Terribacillus saccharophilus]|uniref:Uncharacterized protein n=1 Tax=Terribacillus saccharophilus TaxID=361277 RepID=A0ABX4GW95_9BACI|nr:hypothetical protein [Terribacillus saccharophilus]PAD34830.1 hypothetical protein CHH56_12490 [Terribacillus saccharophilus]PAD95578.1 hypothetical protein CHH50_12725 [Terribacillus saccharophilus]PAD99155.1 hypothetical protein CHH48_13620 [Terribacillus saccharophilus]
MLTLRRTANYTVCAIHLGILTFWLAAWEQLFTMTGLVIWGGSALLGALFFMIRRRQSENMLDSSDRILAISTVFIVVLALVSVLIEYTVASMP